ncbi:MAG: KH domain-containing protein [Leptospiraceae bacterium]|nr:KH domain-containing protein [Leptospiraceae bacterium]MCB1315808.1 KH domain-containing protein [Leptospiraceae bacterium]
MVPVQLVEYIVGSLVSHPDEVAVRTIDGNEETIIEIRVAESDVGKVIGKNGSVARALRTLVSAIGASQQKNYALEIID